MKDEFKHKSAAAKALAVAPSHEVSRALFTLPSTVWQMIDLQRKNTGMSAAQYLTSLVTKASK